MKKSILLILVFLLTLGVSTNNFISFSHDEIEKNNFVNKSELEKQIWNEYMQLDEFKMHFNEDPKDAKAMIDSIVDTKIKINYHNSNNLTPKSGQGNIALIYFPKFKQNIDYYCGPASALTAIYGMGKENSVSGSTYSTKQNTLGKNMNTNKTDGTIVYRMRNELNKYSSESYNYYYQPSKNEMFSIIFGSLLSDNAPILHADTKSLGYYNGYSTGHYVTIVFCNSSFGDGEIGGLAVMDNNRKDEFYGTQDISLNEAYNSIRGRYLIGVSL